VWIKQRSRWFKGWLQTWLVHMRNPALLGRNLGWFNTFIFHAIITGLIISALTHPLFLISLGITIYHFIQAEQISSYYVTMAVFDLSNILLGYIAFVLLAWRSLPVSGLTGLRPRLVGIPIYWLLISFGAWRAVWHLIYRTYEWEKTPHSCAESDTSYPDSK
jgi:cellulose synthase/poly-beta-1,6-N-acetylglucosamine synthase-like glycosyltransferase